MMFNVNQIYIFCTFVLAGIVMGVLYSFTHFDCRSLLRVFIDVVYGVVVCSLLFALNMIINYGRADLYCLVGVIIGIYFYCKTLRYYIDILVLRLYNITTNGVSKTGHDTD
ncbi:MAG: hypothetical protein PHW00_01860 [Clostridia bacterium]|nr:hypothetical protein [Clostridia bacterium]